jgi:hypothetical protein
MGTKTEDAGRLVDVIWKGRAGDEAGKIGS